METPQTVKSIFPEALWGHFTILPGAEGARPVHGSFRLIFPFVHRKVHRKASQRPEPTQNPQKGLCSASQKPSRLPFTFLYLDRARSSSWLQRHPTRNFANFVFCPPAIRRLRPVHTYCTQGGCTPPTSAKSSPLG